ncbi:MAG: hypothetical protein RLZZ618_1475 [Pseudomonadota bacterium]|jgi:hypothetical protein
MSNDISDSYASSATDFAEPAFYEAPEVDEPSTFDVESEPEAHAFEGFEKASKAAPDTGNVNDDVISDVAVNARTAWDRTDLSTAQSTETRRVLGDLGTAVNEGRVSPRLDDNTNRSVYDLATAPAEAPRFDNALQHLSFVSSALSDNAPPVFDPAPPDIDENGQDKPPKPTPSFGEPPSRAEESPDQKVTFRKDGSAVIQREGEEPIVLKPRVFTNEAIKGPAATPESKQRFLTGVVTSLAGPAAGQLLENSLLVFNKLGGNADAKVVATLSGKVELTCSAVQQDCTARVWPKNEPAPRTVPVEVVADGLQLDIGGKKTTVSYKTDNEALLESLQKLPPVERHERVQDGEKLLREKVRDALPGVIPDKAADYASDKILGKLPNLVRSGEYGWGVSKTFGPMKIEVSVKGSVVEAVEGNTRRAATLLRDFIINDILPPGMAKPNLPNVTNR